MSGTFDHAIDHVTIIDCRYPYEYKAGHIKVTFFLNNFQLSPRLCTCTPRMIHCEKTCMLTPKRGAAATTLALTYAYCST